MYLSIFIFLAIELAFVAWGDLRTKKIPNLWSLLNLIIFPLLILLVSDHYLLTIQTALYPLAILLVGFGLFWVGVMGAGDVKFMSTFFLLIPNAFKEDFFVSTLVCTVVVAAIVLAINLVRNFAPILDSIKKRDMQAAKNCFGTKFSYAPVLLMAWLWIGWNHKQSFIY